jgi:hypothetical protein
MLEDQPRDTAFSLKLRVPKKYWWTFTGQASDVGDISFWATGFTQKLRDEPIWSTAQDLDRIPSF